MIKLITGPMKSSKSARLIQEIEDKNFLGNEMLVFKPLIDSRNKGIQSRNGKKINAYEVESFSDIARFIKNYMMVKYIFIDEIQFIDSFGMRVFFLLCKKRKISVIAAGLDLTSELKPFCTTAEFMCYADEIIKVKGTCESCGSPATLSECIDKKLNENLIGDKEYLSKCSNCHIMLKVK